MKNALSLYCIILSCLFLINHQLHAQEKQETRYWVVVAYESRYENYQQINGSAVISNVVRTNCPEDGKGVSNQFNEYYQAYYARQRGFSSLSREVTFGPYKTWEEGERQHRKLLAQHNRDRYGLLVIERFSYLCDKY